MILKCLYLHNFRNYEEEFFEFSPSLNLIFGANAQGKTNLLEAIYYLMTARSFRTHHSSDMIRNEAPHFYLEAHFSKHGIEQTLKVMSSSKERKILYNNTLFPTAAGLLGILQGVILSPDDNSLIKGAPLLRRSFIDLQIAQVNPLYVHHLQRFHRSMQQRNCLLKARNCHTIESWEFEMAASAAYIIIERSKAIKELSHLSQSLYHRLMATSDQFSIEYKTSCQLLENMEGVRDYHLKQFQRLRSREMELKCTLTGPHRDDLYFFLNGKECRFFASEGQQRSCTTALRLAQWHHLKKYAESPLMLIDDLGISLDEFRKELLFTEIAALDQVFLTSTEGNHREFPDSHRKICIQAGRRS